MKKKLLIGLVILGVILILSVYCAVIVLINMKTGLNPAIIIITSVFAGLLLGRFLGQKSVQIIQKIKKG